MLKPSLEIREVSRPAPERRVRSLAESVDLLMRGWSPCCNAIIRRIGGTPCCSVCGATRFETVEGRSLDLRDEPAPPEPRRLGGHELPPVLEHSDPAIAVPWGAERGGAS